MTPYHPTVAQKSGCSLHNSELNREPYAFVFFFCFFFLQRFIQYLASRNTLFNLSNFLDKSGLQGILPTQHGSRPLSSQPIFIFHDLYHHPRTSFLCNLGYDMSTFIRRYSRYLNEKAVSYRQVAFDFTKVKRG